MERAALPLGVKLLIAFFAFGFCACALTLYLLVFPGSPLDVLWRFNPEARDGLRALGKPSVFLMAVVGAACGLSAMGLARGTEWGRRLALGVLFCNLLGDLANALVRQDYRTLIGLPIGGAMIFYLLRLRPQKQTGAPLL